MTRSLSRRAAAEFAGTAFLLAAVVGSGIMAERLAGGNVAIALLANTLATGAALVALILTLGPFSGAHFNPVVTLGELAAGGMGPRDAAAYLAVQILGGIAGTICANLMFGLHAISISLRARTGPTQWFSEFVATFGLLLVIRGCSASQPNATAYAVGTYITAAYWFTASTSFANPAVTIARTLSDTFAGIRPVDAPEFLVAQLTGGIAATVFFRWLASESPRDARNAVGS